MPQGQAKGEPPDVVTVGYALREMMVNVDRQTRFSSIITPDNITEFQLTVEFCKWVPERREEAVQKTVELLEEFPWIALAVLRQLAPKPHPKIHRAYRGNLSYVVCVWLHWAIKSRYITERSRHFLAWLEVVRIVEENFQIVLEAWMSGNAEDDGAFAQIVQEGRRYPSIVLSQTLTNWARGTSLRKPEEWHKLLAAMTGISDPTESMRHAPIPGSHGDPGFPLARWIEWYRRWRPAVAPLAIWAPKPEEE